MPGYHLIYRKQRAPTATGRQLIINRHIKIIDLNILYQILNNKWDAGKYNNGWSLHLSSGPSRFKTDTIPFFSERWNSIRMLLTCSHQCRWLVEQRPSMCYHVYMIMHVKDPKLSVVRERHHVPLAGSICPYVAHMCWTGTLIWVKQTNKNE